MQNNIGSIFLFPRVLFQLFLFFLDKQINLINSIIIETVYLNKRTGIVLFSEPDPDVFLSLICKFSFLFLLLTPPIHGKKKLQWNIIDKRKKIYFFKKLLKGTFVNRTTSINGGSLKHYIGSLCPS